MNFEVIELDEILANLPADPGHRRQMLDYPPNYREAIRRHYFQNGHCQPRDHIMPRKVSDKRCFIIGWFDKFKWLEYSISKMLHFAVIAIFSNVISMKWVVLEVMSSLRKVYNFLILALVLTVATALVERAFSAMKIVKTPLRNKMGDQWLSDSMLVYIERDVFAFIDNEHIMRRFHDMEPRRQQL
ncbi:hypothetical protein DVH24_009954 [Malus domestica]|uniref:HAT C-terminal dimerisation domain-containing protein n=1 Tax=Malus domestica TaxID=3750 RepID=A0A498JNX8_MALDO|nr:hypothetical protein DVH24_009954 [Malus domestica]